MRKYIIPQFISSSDSVFWYLKDSEKSRPNEYIQMKDIYGYVPRNIYILSSLYGSPPRDEVCRPMTQPMYFGGPGQARGYMR